MTETQAQDILDGQDEMFDTLDDIKRVVGQINDRAVRTETRLSKLLIHNGLKFDGTAPLTLENN
jgi:hypothetical protein